MIIDCDRCAMRGRGCADCVVTVLLGPPDEAADPVLAPEVRRAIDIFAAADMLAQPQPVPAPFRRGARATGRARPAGRVRRSA